ncbi:MAG: glucans biosynthesis glucosyltransferase MdoH, partial [Pseudomonadota bacterium]
MDSLTPQVPIRQRAMPRVNWPLRRSAFFLAVFSITVAGVWRLADLMGDGGFTPIEIAILIVFTLNFSWIAGAFVTALIGFLLKVMSDRPVAVASPIFTIDPAGERPVGRTAIAVPVFNEATDDVFARLHALANSLRRTGARDCFDLFLLSDSSDEAVAASERVEVDRFRAIHGGPGSLRYRRRETNEGKKAGNIADFCRQWGDDYDYLVVLDADSVMSGDALLRLARLMDARPNAGIIQTLPRLIGQNSLFGRLEQFGYRLCCDVMALGLAFWQGPDGNYFGHNAIVRLAAFRDHCELPTVRGRGPLAGEIMSHDFVEAALLRRAGYEIWFVPDGRGSFEGCPENAVDHAKRDRRWCQGNLQHAWLLTMRGLRPLSRLHLIIGITSYVASLWWLMLIVLGIAARMTADVVPDYFAGALALFPTWPIDRSFGFFSLLMVTLFLLFMPKVFGLTLLLFDNEGPDRLGGKLKLLLSAVIEALYSALRAPVLMVFHTMFIVMIFLGRRIGWDPQVRDARTVGLKTAFWLHLPQTLFALA